MQQHQTAARLEQDSVRVFAFDVAVVLSEAELAMINGGAGRISYCAGGHPCDEMPVSR